MNEIFNNNNSPTEVFFLKTPKKNKENNPKAYINNRKFEKELNEIEKREKKNKREINKYNKTEKEYLKNNKYENNKNKKIEPSGNKKIIEVKNANDKIEDIVEIEVKIKNSLNEILELLSNFINMPIQEIIDKYNVEDLQDIEIIKNIIKEEMGIINNVDLISLDGFKEMIDTITQINTNIEENLKILDEYQAGKKNIDIENFSKTVTENVSEVDLSQVDLSQTDKKELVNKSDYRVDSDNKANITKDSSLEKSSAVDNNDEQSLEENKSNDKEKNKHSNNMDNAFGKKEIGKIENFTNETEINIQISSDKGQKSEVYSKNINKANNTFTLLEKQNVMKQVIHKIDTIISEEYSEMKIELRPRDLGDMTLKVITQNGIVTAQIIAENQKVKEIVESSLMDLETLLQDKGVQIAQVSVTLKEKNNEQMDSFNKEKNKSTKRINDIINNIEEEYKIEQEEAEYLENGEVIKSKIEYKV